MDPLSLTASLIAISQLTAVIVDYLGKVRNAPKERSQIAIEVSNIYHLLTTLRYRFEDGEFDEDWCQAISMLAAQNGPLNQYQQALESIKKKVEKSDRFSSFAASILWPFSKGELSELLSTIERLKTLVLVALETDHLKLSQTIKQTVDAIYNNNKIIMDDAYSIKKSLPALHSKVEEIDQHQLRDAILAWMSFQDYSVQHSDIMAKLPSACGVWFLQSEEFMGWLEGSNHTLFCPGIPGAGKTTTAAIAIDFLLKTAKDRSAAVAYVYCNYKSNSRQSALSIFGSLLKQLLRFCSTISESLLGQRKVSVRLSFDDILRELRFVLRESAVTYIVIDALDECLNDEGDVARLLVALRDLQGEGRFRLLCTSRFIPDIEAHFKADPRLEISARDVDVRHFVSCQIYRFPRCIQKDPELQQLVVKRIAETAGGMFLLARLYVDSLVDKRTKAKVRATLDRLSQMSQSIDEAYGEALERLDSQPFEDRSLAKRAISWIVCAQRPLTTDELRHALSVVPGQRELDMDDIVDAEDIVSVCAGLVTVDRESGIIRLVHHTAQEYFQRTRPIWSNLVQQDYFASICLTYLCFDYFADQTTAPDGATMMALYPFLSYTARYWGVHAQPAQETVTVLALRLLLNGTLVSLSAQAALIDSRAGHMEDDGGLDQQITNMHLMADFGLDLIIPQVISRQGTAALDALDRNGRSPLTCAAKNGHSAVVSLLLDHNVNIDAGDHLGRRPLSYAASGGHHIVVRLLLQHNDKADARDASGRTPLWWAAQNGSTAAAKELLSHGGVDVNAADPWTGQTPLLLAARGGFKEMVKLLLNQNDINPDVFDIKGRTALWYAAEQNHPEIAHILLENESVMKNARDIYGQTPLATAASRGNTATVALLLHYNKVDVKSRDIYGRAPLALAAENGHATVIEQLLARCDIEADCRDQDNWTPLHSAAFEGHRPVLEALLRHGVANINAASKGGLTPLSCANIRSPNDCVTMLL
ncbi:ankyrin repeat-containing domain protein, partial [Cladorrhinum sp. PSN259]